MGISVLAARCKKMEPPLAFRLLNSLRWSRKGLKIVLGLLCLLIGIVSYFLLGSQGNPIEISEWLLLPGESNLVFQIFITRELRANPEYLNGIDKILEKYPKLSPKQKTVLKESILLTGGGRWDDKGFKGTLVFFCAQKHTLKNVQDLFEGTAEIINGNRVFRSRNGFWVLMGTNLAVLNCNMTDEEMVKILSQKFPALEPRFLGPGNIGLRTMRVSLALNEGPGKKLQQINANDLKALPIPELQGLVDLLPVVQQAKLISASGNYKEKDKIWALDLILFCENHIEAEKGRISLMDFWEIKGKAFLANALLLLPVEDPHAKGIKLAINDLSNTFKIQTAGPFLTASLAFSKETLQNLGKGFAHFPFGFVDHYFQIKQ